MRRKPPINWVRSFELAARHRNLSRAAEELGVTHGAVSRQVSQLEKFLLVPLVERSNTGLDLTRQGERLFEQLRDGFALIDRALSELEPGLRQLAVTVLPSFAVHWLVSRLGRFYVRNSDLEIRLLTTRRLVDLTREEVDIGLRYGGGNWTGLESDLILRDDLMPVAAPDLAAEIDWTRPDSYLSKIVMTDAIGDYQNWQNWFKAADLPPHDLTRQPVYDDTVIAMQACLQGQALILGRSSLVERDLVAGRLVALPGPHIESPHAMYLVYRKGEGRRREINRFREWLLEEAGAS